MAHTINKVEDPAAVLAIPDDADVEIVRELLERGYKDVKPQYEHGPTDEMPKHIERKGTLMMELMAQLG